MRKVKLNRVPLLLINNSEEGEAIENKIERIVTQNEPINDGAPLIYTERSEGLKPEYDIRTDRFEIAVEAMDKVAAAKIARRQVIADKAASEKEEARIQAEEAEELRFRQAAAEAAEAAQLKGEG